MQPTKLIRNTTAAISAIVAIILLQTLYYKFSAHPDSVYIFSELGMEPWGRWGVGAAELMIGIMLFIPKTRLLAALAALGTISGAIYFHIFRLGIVVQNDGGILFMLAMAVFIGSLIILILNRKTLLETLKRFIGSASAAVE